MVAISCGEIWWGEKPKAKPRPYLVLTRTAAISVLPRILVAPVSRTIRGIPSEVALGAGEGLMTDCVANLDGVGPIRKSFLVRRMGAIGPSKRHELCAAIAASIDC